MYSPTFWANFKMSLLYKKTSVATIWATLGKLGNFFTQTVRIGEVKLCPNGAELTEGKILKQDALSFGKKVSNFTSMNFELAKLPRFRQLFKYFCFKSELVQHFQLSLTPNCSVTRLGHKLTKKFHRSHVFADFLG